MEVVSIDSRILYYIHVVFPVLKLVTGNPLAFKWCWNGHWVSTISGSLSIVCVQLGPRMLSVVWSSRVSAIQGLLTYVSGILLGTTHYVRITIDGRISGVSVERGSTVRPTVKCWHHSGWMNENLHYHFASPYMHHQRTGSRCETVGQAFTQSHPQNLFQTWRGLR